MALAGQCHYCAWFQQGDDSVVLMLLLVSLAHLTSLLWAVFPSAPILHKSPAHLKSPHSTIQSFQSHSQVRRELCEIPAVCCMYSARGGFQLNEVLAIYSKERLEEGVRRELCCRALQIELGISPLETSCEKNSKTSSCFLFTRGQARQRGGINPSQMKLARISKKCSVHK